MRYSFRLAELLGHSPDPRKRPGTVKAIVEHTGLDRHQVAALLKNEVKYIPLHALSRLCDYLIEHGYVAAEQLPGALFAVEPEHFWEVLARRQRLELCLGVRRPQGHNEPDGAWVVASDSLLLGELLNGVSTLGGAAKHTPRSGGEEPAPPFRSAPHPEHLRQTLVWSPGAGKDDDEVFRRASEVYDDFLRIGGDKALVCLGSIKSNPVAELVLAEVFGAPPFVSQDDVASPAERSCPLLLRYRSEDPHPAGCSGGVRLSKDQDAPLPGIYFETADGSWDVAPWEPERRDAALVFYIHRESQGRLEMLLGGFSGRATRLLARTLATQAAEFWPPVYSGQGLQVGAFVVKFEFAPQGRRERDILHPDLAVSTKAIPLAESVIARRLDPTFAG